MRKIKTQSKLKLNQIMKRTLLCMLSIVALSLSLYAQTKTYGILLYNGIAIETDDKLLGQLLVSGGQKSIMDAMVYADIVDALRSGMQVSYNSATNTIKGVSFKRVERGIRENVNAARDEYSYKRSLRIRRKWARQNSPEHQFMVALENFGKEWVLQSKIK